MSPPLHELVARIDTFAAHAPICDGMRQAIGIADVDPEMALTRVRKVLEYVVRQVHESRLQEPAGTRPLENLLQQLVREGHWPRRLAAYANGVRELGNVGTHSFGEGVTAEDVRQSLMQLLPIVEWFVEQTEPAPPPMAPPPPPPPLFGTKTAPSAEVCFCYLSKPEIDSLCTTLQIRSLGSYAAKVRDMEAQLQEQGRLGKNFIPPGHGFVSAAARFTLIEDDEEYLAFRVDGVDDVRMNMSKLKGTLWPYRSRMSRLSHMAIALRCGMEFRVFGEWYSERYIRPYAASVVGENVQKWNSLG